MGSGGKVREPKAAPPPARAPRPGDAGESGSPSRRQRLIAASRKGFQQSILAGETGGFQSAQGAAVARAGKSILG